MGNWSKLYCSVVAELTLTSCLVVSAAHYAIAEQFEHPQLVVRGSPSAREIELLMHHSGMPQILWRENEAEAGHPLDRKLHLASRLPQGWRESLPPSFVSGATPIGAYDKKGKLYLLSQFYSLGKNLEVHVLSSDNYLLTHTVNYHGTDNIAPKFLAPPTENSPLHLIFDGAEWRWTPWGFWIGHFKTSYGKYFSTQWNGQGWTPPVQIVDRGKFEVTDIACNTGPPSHVVCVWTDNRHGPIRNSLFFSEFDGRSWSKNVELGEDHLTSLGMDLSVAVNGGGQAVVVFVPRNVKDNEVEFGGILLREQRSGIWSSVQQLSATGKEPRLSVDPQQRVHLIWQEGRSIMHRLQLGNEWTPPTALVEAGGKIRYLTPLRFSPDGQAHLAWSTWAGQESQIWYQAFRFE